MKAADFEALARELGKGEFKEEDWETIAVTLRKLWIAGVRTGINRVLARVEDAIAALEKETES